MKALYRKRLLKLAHHLESGKLGHEKFYFGQWNTDKCLCQMQKNGCGYAGCAIGEAPFAFPRQWRFHKGHPRLKGIRTGPLGQAIIPEISAMKFFGLEQDELDHLFIPCLQSPSEFAGTQLNRDATPRQVAANIRAFIKRKEQKP